MPRTANLEARQRILDAAHKLFYTGGLNAVSMDCVAAAAGMNEHIAQLARHSYDPVGAIQRIFEEAAGLMRQSQCSGGCFFGNLAQETADGNETIRQKVAQHLHAWTTELATFFERWRQSGYFREDFQPQVAAQAILALLEGALLFCKASKSPAPVDSAKHLAVAYLEAVRA